MIHNPGLARSAIVGLEAEGQICLTASVFATELRRSVYEGHDENVDRKFRMWCRKLVGRAQRTGDRTLLTEPTNQVLSETQ